MITDENHPEMRLAVADLVQMLATVAQLRPVLDNDTHRLLREVRDEHRRLWLKRGVDFPFLVMIAVPRLGTHAVEFWREDLDLKNLRVKVVNLVKLYTSLTPREVWAALHAAYPTLRPGDLTRPIFEELFKPDKVDSEEARMLEEELKRLG